ncbi:MAG TPA: hypothetical protein DEP84_13305 [Chloroflexi bacterium]|nr:hypothetical protein [Chloroflexota bacterium]
MIPSPISVHEKEETEISHLRRQVALLEQRNRELTALHAVAEAASEITDLNELLSKALDAVLRAAGIPELQSMGGIFLIDDETGLMHLVAWRGLHPDLVRQDSCLPLGECLCGLVGQHGRTLVSLNSCHDPRHTRQTTLDEPHGHIIAPLTARGRTVGVLSLYLSPDHPPDPSYVELVTAIGQQLGMAVEQARLYRQLQSAVERLRETRDKVVAQNARLGRSNRELQVTYDLTLAMQSTLDIADAQERVLTLITGELGFERAILALVDVHDTVLTGWLCSTRSSGTSLQRIPHTTRLGLHAASGVLAQAVLKAEPLLVTDGGPPTTDPQINSWLGMHHYAILPLVIRRRPLGVLLVDNPESGHPIGDDDLAPLTNIARQASMVLGNVQLCIDRTRRLAVEEERCRIAMEIHDAISQQLYGITYTLDASVKLLPERAEEVREKLTYLLPQAQQASAAVRRAIFDLWPDELDAERFAAELHAYVKEIVFSNDLSVQIDIDRQFDTLAIEVRRQLYRIAQEALTNVIKHSRAQRTEIILTATLQEIRLTITDDGQGFNLADCQLEADDRNHFGLISMRERAEALGGRLQIDSHPRYGTKVTVTLPLCC